MVDTEKLTEVGVRAELFVHCFLKKVFGEVCISYFFDFIFCLFFVFYSFYFVCTQKLTFFSPFL